MLEFVQPQWFWCMFILLPYLIYEIIFKDKKRLTIKHSRVDDLRKIKGSNSWLRFIPLLLRIIIIVLLITALSRPRLAHQKQSVKGKGIDIMLVIDVSGSMMAIDFQPVNRLEAAKKVGKEFIDNRHNDRIGLVVFAENAFTQCPLTLDYNILMSIMGQVVINKEANGTAIGMGLATAVARMKDSESKSKVIILITDGRNNTGEIDPITAAQLAKTYEIKVYTVGVGSKEMVDLPYQTPYGVRYRKQRVEIDMETLNEIASITGTENAKRAHNTDELKTIMDYIDNLEKTELKIENYFQYQELFWIYLLIALFVLVLEISIRFIFNYELP